jgi:hypothetical protein
MNLRVDEAICSYALPATYDWVSTMSPRLLSYTAKKNDSGMPFTMFFQPRHQWSELQELVWLPFPLYLHLAVVFG